MLHLIIDKYAYKPTEYLSCMYILCHLFYKERIITIMYNIIFKNTFHRVELYIVCRQAHHTLFIWPVILIHSFPSFEYTENCTSSLETKIHIPNLKDGDNIPSSCDRDLSSLFWAADSFCIKFFHCKNKNWLLFPVILYNVPGCWISVLQFKKYDVCTDWFRLCLSKKVVSWDARTHFSTVMPL